MFFKRVSYLSIALNFLFIIAGGYYLHTKGGFSYISSKISPVSQNQPVKESSDPHYKTRVSVFEKDEIQSGGIVFLGDSLTENNNWNEDFAKSYNRGIGGDTTDGVLNRLDNITKNKPSKVFLMIGINDIAHGKNSKEVLKNYNQILNKIKNDSPTTQIFVQSTLPINTSQATIKIDNNTILEVDKTLKENANSMGYKYIDLTKFFINKSNELDSKWTYDGIHIKGNAYQIWEKAISEYVKS
jgi:lysophospholipase L1-like esterase